MARGVSRRHGTAATAPVALYPLHGVGSGTLCARISGKPYVRISGTRKCQLLTFVVV